MSTGLGRYASVLIAAAAVTATAAVALADPVTQRLLAGASTEELTLSDDDGGQPLFSIPDLEPGARVERCITLRYSGERPSNVTLEATADGRFAQRLQLTVARGTGGAFGNCEGFQGRNIYVGSLADAANVLGQAEGWRASEDESPSTSYKLTIEAPANLQSDADGAKPTFAWTAKPIPQDPPPPTPTVDRPPTVVTGTAPKPVPAPPAAPKSEPADEKPAPAARETRPPAMAPAAPTRKPRADDGFFTNLREAVGEVAERAAFPLILLAAMVLFLLLQNRLDRRDPKLALAPVHSSPDLRFHPLPVGAH